MEHAIPDNLGMNSLLPWSKTRSCHNRNVGGREWLKKLGMAEYPQRLVENRIDLSVLPDVTDQDLEKLGRCWVIAAKCCARPATSAAFQLPLRHPRCPWRASQLGKTAPRAGAGNSSQ